MGYVLSPGNFFGKHVIIDVLNSGYFSSILNEKKASFI